MSVHIGLNLGSWCQYQCMMSSLLEQGDAEWAKDAMQRVWTEETQGGHTRLKGDYPD